MDAAERWPALPWSDWEDTGETLHLWMQIVGKVKLELAPFLNQWWEVGFHVTARGMTTGMIPAGGQVFEVIFDFLDHNLAVVTSRGQVKIMPLMPRSVADFYGEFMSILTSIGVDIAISTSPIETPMTVPYDQDADNAAYDGDAVTRFWRVLLETTRVLERYRSSFVGKSSPVLFYWGSFDLNEARYSGRPATPPEGPRFYQLAENEENVACGFWPGNPNAAGIAFGEPAFYSYTNPAPEGFKDATVQPDVAYFDNRLGEFVLRYEDARRAPLPEEAILSFFQSAYEAGASLSHWDRSGLERTPHAIGGRRRSRSSPASPVGP